MPMAGRPMGTVSPSAYDSAFGTVGVSAMAMSPKKPLATTVALVPFGTT